jgi:hypothetical protein
MNTTEPYHKGLHIAVNASFLGIPFWHHGILVGDGTVIHYASSAQKSGGKVKRVMLKTFSGGRKVFVLNYLNQDPETTVRRAIERLNETDYHLTENNCEHFARYCKTGNSVSEQKCSAMYLACMAGLALISAPVAGVFAAAGLYIDKVDRDATFVPLGDYRG